MKTHGRSTVWVVALTLLIGHLVEAQEPKETRVEIIGSPQYFAVRVGDVEQSVEWYLKVFGLRRVGGSEAEDGSWRIENLQNDQLLVEIIRDDRAREAGRAHGFFKVRFQVPDVDVVAHRIERATGELPRVVEFPTLGHRVLQLRDPEGNVIQLSSPIIQDE